jgi:hypothetical protein
MLIRSKYSAKEIALFDHFGLLELTEHLEAIPLYRTAAIHAFVANDQTPWATSLRRCLKAIGTGTPQRETPEWDDLIISE